MGDHAKNTRESLANYRTQLERHYRAAERNTARPLGENKRLLEALAAAIEIYRRDVLREAASARRSLGG